MQTRKLYIVSLSLFVCSLLFISGCKSTPPFKITGRRGTPVGKYDYLEAVVRYSNVAE